MDLLLTGASGFIGKNLLLHAPAGWRILALYNQDAGFPEFVAGLNKPAIMAARCDLTDPGEVAALFRKFGSHWDSCLYLAAKVDIPWSVREPKQDLSMNTGSLLNLLDGLKARNFVYFSSGAVYDGLQGEVHPDARLAPTLPYAISKLACERYVEFYGRRQKSIENYTIVRFFGAYGPYEAPHKIYTRLLRSFALDGNASYTIYGDGKNLIDAMYVDDAVSAVLRILRGNRWNHIVNLAGGHPISIETLVVETATALGLKAVKVEKQGVAHESNPFWGSTAEMRELFGFEPKVSLAEGITRFKDFLLAHGSTTPQIREARG